MSPASHIPCPRCGAMMEPEEAFCPACLLGAVSGEGPGPEAERIFQAALELVPAERIDFLRAQTSGNAALLAAVEMLLRGYEEAGGDAAGLTHGAAARPPAAQAGAGGEEPGAMIDHFRLVGLIGEGGMGSVWRAEQQAPVQRTVALKVIKLGMDTREVVKRFERERQTLALLNHPNIAQVYEAGATALGRPYFAMELAEGRPITAYCDAAALDLAARLKLFQEVCAAVEHAHQKGIIHRDLKPSNILVAAGTVKVIDFGVAKATQQVANTLFTREAQILGTPAYMSPEQAQTAGLDIDTRTDIYSLGVVLYELLTGAPPIDPERLARTSVGEMQRILLEEEPPTPSTRLKTSQVAGPAGRRAAARGGALRGDLDWVVMKAIRKERNERYPSAAALSEDLRRFLAGEPVLAVPPTLGYRTGKFLRRHYAGVTAGALVLIAMVVGMGVSFWEAVRASRAERVSTQTLADMYARSGLAAAEGGDASRATLWFANAALIAARDPQRAEANTARAAAWGRNAVEPIWALQTPFSRTESLVWNPRQPAIILNGAGAGGALIWDLATDRLWTPGFAGPLRHAIWDARGERIAAACGEDLILCDYPAGREKSRWPATVAVAMAFSPDNRFLAVGSQSAFCCNLETGERRPLALQGESPTALSFSRDGRLLLIQWGKLVGLCEVTNLSRFLHPPVPNEPGGQANFLGDANSYFTAGPEGETNVRDTQSGQVQETYPHTDFLPRGYPVAASADGRFIARSNGPGIDRMTRAQAGFPAHKNVMSAVCFGPDGAWFASGSADNTAKLWTLPDGKFAGEIGHHQSDVNGLAFSADSSLVASAQEHLVRVWRLASPPASRLIPLDKQSLVTVSPDGRLLALSGWTIQGSPVTDRTRVIDIASDQAVGPDLVTGGVILGAAFSPDGAWLAVITSTTPERQNARLETTPGSGNLQFWNWRTGERLGGEIQLPSEPRGLAIHPSGQWVGLCCNGGKGLEVDVGTRQVRILFDQQNYTHSHQTLNNGRCGYSPDGRVFVLWGSPPFTHLWEREQGRELVPLDQIIGTSFDVAFHGDTIGLALLDRQPRLEFWNSRTGKPAAPSIAYSGWPFLGRFSADGQFFLSTGRNHVGEIWDWRVGRRVCPALPHDDEVMGGTFVPGRPWVATGAHDNLIKLWDYHSGMLMAPPIHTESRVFELQMALGGRVVVASTPLKGVEIIDLKAWVPEPGLDAASVRLLAEIDASAEVHPGGDLVPLGAEEWVQRWQAFRRQHPDYAGHRPPLEPSEQKAWHIARARELEALNPTAATWHRQRAEGLSSRTQTPPTRGPF